MVAVNMEIGFQVIATASMFAKRQIKQGHDGHPVALREEWKLEVNLVG